MKTVKIHFINEEDGSLIAAPLAKNAPVVGDEIRLTGERYYRVTRRCWAYDERTGIDVDRVNIGVRPVSLDDENDT